MFTSKASDVERLAKEMEAEQRSPRHAQQAVVRAAKMSKGELAALVFEQRHSLCTRILPRMKIAVVAVSLLLVACPANQLPVGPSPPSGGTPGAPLATKDVVGYWSGDWGNLVFREQGGEILGSYDHDDGTIVGTIVGNQLVGWWCEAPSRKPDMDAGPVEMKFITNADGSRVIDGRWRFASEGDAWKDDWDITWSTGQAPDVLVKRFADAEAFCVKP